MNPDKTNLLTIPPALEAEIQAVADEAHRPASEIVQEALEGYLAERHATARPTPDARRRSEVVARMLELRKNNPLPAGTTIDDILAYRHYGRA